MSEKCRPKAEVNAFTQSIRRPELGDLRIDHHFEFGWLHDRQIGRLGPLEDAADIAVLVLQVDAVALKPPKAANSSGATDGFTSALRAERFRC
jgi:hypothetical protein